MAETKENRFGGLDMEDLIGGPLNAVRDARSILAHSTLDVIESVGLQAPDTNGVGNVRTANFSFDKAAEQTAEGKSASERVEMNVPLLAIVKVPVLSIEEKDVTFDIEVKSSTSSDSSSDKNGV